MQAHEIFMQRCLQLAMPNIRASAPNPSVGAVLVHENKIISEGCTSPYGGAHAEVNCINNLLPSYKHKLSESTLYVSLEPCSHFGKTPPCADLIIECKIPEVVIGSKDPNPLVAGSGIEKLLNAGIKVSKFILENDCIELNKRFYTFHQKSRPYIILKWAQSADGFFAPINNKQFWITNEAAKTLVHQWRSEEMAIMVASKTAIIDNPKLNVRLVDGKQPTRILVDRHLKTPITNHLFDDSQSTIVFTSKYSTKFNLNKTEFYQINFEGNWLVEMLEILHKKNIQSIIVEGGAILLNQFINNNLWDEARIITGSKLMHEGIVAPTVIGTNEINFPISDNSCKIVRNLHP